MSFNGSGTYSLPAGNPVTTGTTISSTWANSTLSDIASALTNCVTRDGQSPPTANVPMGGYKLTGLGQATATGDALGWGKNASIVDLTVTGTCTLSANPTTNLQAATKQYVDTTAQSFPSGTVMLFVQTSAPTGWTKSTTHDNKALRVVSGTASSGGSIAFTTAFANGNAGSTTLSTAQMPSHNHQGQAYAPSNIGGSNPWSGFSTTATLNNFTSWQLAINSLGAPTYLGVAYNGGGGSHTHSLSLAVQYVDVIIATKN